MISIMKDTKVNVRVLGLSKTIPNCPILDDVFVLIDSDVKCGFCCFWKRFKYSNEQLYFLFNSFLMRVGGGLLIIKKMVFNEVTDQSKFCAKKDSYYSNISNYCCRLGKFGCNSIPYFKTAQRRVGSESGSIQQYYEYRSISIMASLMNNFLCLHHAVGGC